MKHNAVIGIDIGTTGCRAVIYGSNGQIFSSQALEYPLFTPHAAWVEQDADEIYQKVIRVTKLAIMETKHLDIHIRALSFSSVLHSLIPVATDGSALSNMLIWADCRSQKYSEMLKLRSDALAIYQRTGCPIHPMCPLSKILWFKNEQPDIFNKTYKFISIKEYILYRLLGKYIVDKSIASGTGLYNIHECRWDKNLLDLIGINESQLSTVMPTTHKETGILPYMAEELNISSDTPIILGAGDGVLSNLGAGAVMPGEFTAMIGTSGAVRAIVDKPIVDAKARTWCYNLTDNHWVIGGALNNGGIVFRWIKDLLGHSEQEVAKLLQTDVYDLLSTYAKKVPVGSNGLIVLPFLAGERAPNWNANSRGVFFGLNLSHSKEHIIRAVLEGVIYRMYSVFNILEEVSGHCSQIYVSGSFTRSNVWVQIMADVFNRSINVPGEPEGAAFGAAVLGFIALGIYKDINDVKNLANIQKKYQPISANNAVYGELYNIYDRIYWNLQNEFQDIATFQARQN